MKCRSEHEIGRVEGVKRGKGRVEDETYMTFSIGHSDIFI
jgi:hypothetical protein